MGNSSSSGAPKAQIDVAGCCSHHVPATLVLAAKLSPEESQSVDFPGGKLPTNCTALSGFRPTSIQRLLVNPTLDQPSGRKPSSGSSKEVTRESWVDFLSMCRKYQSSAKDSGRLAWHLVAENVNQVGGGLTLRVTGEGARVLLSHLQWPSLEGGGMEWAVEVAPGQPCLVSLAAPLAGSLPPPWAGLASRQAQDDSTIAAMVAAGTSEESFLAWWVAKAEGGGDTTTTPPLPITRLPRRLIALAGKTSPSLQRDIICRAMTEAACSGGGSIVLCAVAVSWWRAWARCVGWHSCGAMPTAMSASDESYPGEMTLGGAGAGAAAGSPPALRLSTPQEEEEWKGLLQQQRHPVVGGSSSFATPLITPATPLVWLPQECFSLLAGWYGMAQDYRVPLQRMGKVVGGGGGGGRRKGDTTGGGGPLNNPGLGLSLCIHDTATAGGWVVEDQPLRLWVLDQSSLTLPTPTPLPPPVVGQVLVPKWGSLALGGALEWLCGGKVGLGTHCVTLRMPRVAVAGEREGELSPFHLTLWDSGWELSEEAQGVWLSRIFCDVLEEATMVRGSMVTAVKRGAGRGVGSSSAPSSNRSFVGASSSSSSSSSGRGSARFNGSSLGGGVGVGVGGGEGNGGLEEDGEGTPSTLPPFDDSDEVHSFASEDDLPQGTFEPYSAPTFNDTFTLVIHGGSLCKGKVDGVESLPHPSIALHLLAPGDTCDALIPSEGGEGGELVWCRCVAKEVARELEEVGKEGGEGGGGSGGEKGSGVKTAVIKVTVALPGGGSSATLTAPLTSTPSAATQAATIAPAFTHCPPPLSLQLRLASIPASTVAAPSNASGSMSPSSYYGVGGEIEAGKEGEGKQPATRPTTPTSYYTKKEEGKLEEAEEPPIAAITHATAALSFSEPPPLLLLLLLLPPRCPPPLPPWKPPFKPPPPPQTPCLPPPPSAPWV